MASLKSIRKRIRSVKNTQQITKAMKMVAAAKLRRAQEGILSARPFALKMDEVLRGVGQRVDVAAHPLLQRREVKRVQLVVLTSDRGLCGGFNSNVLRKAQRYLLENQERFESIGIRTVGRKANDFFRRRGVAVKRDYPGIFAGLNIGVANDLAHELTAEYMAGDVDAVYLVYNEFLSAISQKVSLVELLPIAALEGAEVREGLRPVEYVYEPGRERVLNELLPRYLANKVWRALLESVASEHGARMSAMDSATKNASEMIGKLSLVYNRTRQAAITKELMEIVSGAEALK
jgi:F-type H+-transporting ATPase subunit gamma